MAVNVGDIQAVFRVIDEASAPLNKIAGEVQSSTSGFATLTSVVKGATIAATAAVAAITAVGAAVIKIGEYGSGVGDITEQFGKLAEKAGVDATQALNALRQATAGTVSDLDLMKSALPLLQSGFKGSAEDLRTMAEAARVLSERGMSLDAAMTAVTSAMTTGRTRTLAMQGVIIDTASSMKVLQDAATAEGDAVQESAALHLKQQEILKGLKGLVEENGAVMDDFSDKTNQVRVSFANLYNTFAKQVADSPALGAALDKVGQALGRAFGGDQEAAIKSVTAWVERAGVAVADMAAAAIDWFTRMRPTILAVAAAVGGVLLTAWNALVAVLTTTGSWLGQAKAWFDALPAPVREAAKAIGVFTAAVILLSDALKILGASSLIGGIGAASGAVAALGGQLASIVRLASVVGTGSAISLVFTNIAASATAALGPIGALAVAIASATATLMAGYQAWKWWNESAERAGDSARSVEAASRQMELASKLVGYQVLSQADALIILREEAERQRNSVRASVKASQEDASAKATQTVAIKATAAALKQMAEAEAAMSGAKQIADTRALIATYDRLAKQGIPATIEAQKALHKAVEASIAIYVEAGQTVPPQLLRIEAATKNAANGLDRWSSETALARDEVWKFGQVLENEVAPAIAATANLMNVVLLPAVVKTGGVFDEMGNRIGELAADAADGMEKAGEAAAVSWGEGFTTIAANFGSLMSDAIINGDWRRAFAALGSQLGSFLGEKLGALLGNAIGGMFGKVVGAILPGVGSMLGPLVDKFWGWVTKAEGKRVNDLRDAYIAASGGLHALNVQAHAAGVTLDALLRAKTVKDYEKAIVDLNRELEVTAGLQQDLADAQAELAGRSVMDWEKAQGLIEKYGGTLETLGQKFVEAKSYASWKEIIDDFETLEDMGADVGGVLAAMSDEISTLVQTSIKMGTEIPENMRPFIEELVRAGKLVDENGEAITDLSQLKFGAPLVSELDKLILKIDDLIKALTERLVPAFEGIGNVNIPDVEIGYKFIAKNEMPEGYDVPVPSYASGSGGYVDFGSGTLALLHGKERVMTEAEGQASSAGSGTLVMPIQMDGRTVTEIIIKRLGNRLKVNGVNW